MAIEVILKVVPSEYIITLGEKDTAKEAWESLDMMRAGDGRIKKSKVREHRLP